MLVRPAGAARRKMRASVSVVTVLGDPRREQVQVEMLVCEQGLPTDFDPETLAFVASLPEVDAEEVLAREPLRRDLREVTHVTIDGEDARDFDDAVAARQEGTKVRVWVSIADVAHYVPASSAIDRDARARGTSVYFPHRVIPMLPARLADDLCSLVPHKPRRCLTCEMLVHADGRCTDTRIYDSLIQSAARLTYEEVQRVLTNEPAPKPPWAGALHSLTVAARALRAGRYRRGAIELELPEAQISLDHEGRALDVHERTRTEAHLLIEDLMIAANEAVASTLLAQRRPTLFRVHEAPDKERIAALATFAGTLGLSLDVAATKEPSELARLARRLAANPRGKAFMPLLLQSLARARYDKHNLGHYGLASRAYLHFTSPIRRYPDLIVHRSLRAPRGAGSKLADLALKTSELERRAESAARQVEQLMACHVAKRHLGEIFVVIVTGVHAAGAFVRTVSKPGTPWLEGLLPCRELGDDYYTVLGAEQALVGRRSGHRIALGDKLEARLAHVDLERRHIDFMLTRESAARPPLHGRARPA